MDLKISQLESLEGAQVTGADLFAIVDMVNGITKKITYAQMKEIMGGTPQGGLNGQVLYWEAGSATWKNLTKNDVGLGNVNNTSDMNKPVSLAVQGALNLKADKTEVAGKANISYVDNALALKQDKLPMGIDGNVLTLESGVPVWRLGGSGGGGIQINHTVQELPPDGKISITTAMRQMVNVKGVGISQLNANPILSVPQDGAMITIMGMDSLEYFVIVESDTDYGFILTDTFYGTRFATLTVVYDNILKRYIEFSRVNRI